MNRLHGAEYTDDDGQNGRLRPKTEKRMVKKAPRRYWYKKSSSRGDWKVCGGHLQGLLLRVSGSSFLKANQPQEWEGSATSNYLCICAAKLRCGWRLSISWHRGGNIRSSV